jgi:hypothetical protein
VTIATLPSRKPIDALPSRFAPSSYGLRRSARGELVGIGVATFVEPGGGWESGSVFVDLSGQVIAHTGATPHGQGHLTTYAQIVADRLGVPIERVTVRANDTAVVPIGSGTGASRSLTTAGNALARPPTRCWPRRVASPHTCAKPRRRTCVSPTVASASPGCPSAASTGRR